MLVARTGKLTSQPSDPFVVVVSSLKAVKMKLEQFDNDDKLKEPRMLQRAWHNGSVAKQRSMLNIVIFDPWQRSLFSRQRTPCKEPLLAGNDHRKVVVNYIDRRRLLFKINPAIL